MSWSYSGDPATSDLDQCRFWLQDTDATFQLLQDEELLWLLQSSESMQAAPLYAAALAAEVLANRYAKEVSVSADGVNVQIGDLQERFNKLAENLRSQWNDVVAALGDYDFAGIVLDSDTWIADLQPLVFGIGFMDNAEAGQQDYGYYSPGGYSKQYGAETGGAQGTKKKAVEETNEMIAGTRGEHEVERESTP